MSSLRQQRPAHAPQQSESAYSGISAYGAKTPTSDTNSPQFNARNMPPSSSSGNGSYLARGESLTSGSGSGTQSSGNGNGSSNNPSGTSASSAPSSGREPSKSGGSSSASQISPEQSRAIARTHFDALRAWLARENALGNSSSPRNNARDKLTRLTRQQFQELSTDVYDELVRRMDEAAGRPGDRTSAPPLSFDCVAVSSSGSSRAHVRFFPPPRRTVPLCPWRVPPQAEPGSPEARDAPARPVPRPRERRLL